MCTKKALRNHRNAYPDLRLVDMHKYIYQSAFGCEHLLTDEETIVGYIQKEASSCRPHMGEMVEQLDGAYCRVHLEYLKKGLCPRTLGKLFLLSARHEENGLNMLEKKLAVLHEMIRDEELPFDYREAELMAENWRKQGYPACRHSETFRESYGPAYRVLRKEYACFLPVFAKIDTLLQTGKVTVAIEGGSASGKTTFAKLLQDVYDCQVFHMDDFFLRPEQRTAERFAEPGGNVDRERFLEEVLSPLHKGEKIAYRKFDCSTCSIREPIDMMPKELNVVEGVYSMHPELEAYYDLKVFLDVSTELQIKRIGARNTPDMAKRFANEWIPLEKNYFDTMRVKERCDLCIEVV